MNKKQMLKAIHSKGKAHLSEKERKRVQNFISYHKTQGTLPTWDSLLKYAKLVRISGCMEFTLD